MWNPFSTEEDALEDQTDLDTEIRFSAERHPEQYPAVDASDPDWFSGS